MSRSDKDGTVRRDPVEDAFWEIALNHDATGRAGELFSLSDDDDVVENANQDLLGGKVTKYSLPNSSVTLELAQLPPEDGIWSPVGDHAWYSSALLTSLILQGEISVAMGENNNHGSTQAEEPKSIRVLELGSGAVGLSGISFAVALSQQPTRVPSWTVTLTDNDATLLKQLEANVQSNIRSGKIVLAGGENKTPGNMQSIRVEHLDWDLGGSNGGDDNGIDKNDNKDVANPDANSQGGQLLAADVVIGSELAYTHETATALVTVLDALLRKNPSVQIWIVQVTDRYGWSEIVVPALEAKPNVVIESVPLSFDTHDMASTMIPMGGALDRFAFGAFRIRNTQ